MLLARAAGAPFRARPPLAWHPSLPGETPVAQHWRAVSRQVPPAHTDVVRDAGGEENGLLADRRQRGAPLAACKAADVLPRQRDAARIWGVQPLQQGRHGRLAGARPGPGRWGRGGGACGSVHGSSYDWQLNGREAGGRAGRAGVPGGRGVATACLHATRRPRRPAPTAHRPTSAVTLPRGSVRVRSLSTRAPGRTG